MANENVTDLDLLRLVLLYALRYEKHSNNDVAGLVSMLTRKGLAENYKRVSTSSINNYNQGSTSKFCLCLFFVQIKE